MKCSRIFIAADLEVLKPDIIILPETIYKKEKSFLENFETRTKLIRIYQMNATVINCKITPRFEKMPVNQLIGATT